MLWMLAVAVLIVGYLAFRFLVKPVLKIGLVLVLAVIIWLLLTNYL
jgi:hypothetical protein